MAASETSKAVHMFANIARVGVGIVFLLSGVSKLYSPIAAQRLLLHIVPIPEYMASFATTMLSILECIPGGMLCANRMVITVSLILGAFLLASTMAGVLFVASPVSCGCFGDLIESRTDQWFLLRDFCLLGFVAFVHIALLVLVVEVLVLTKQNQELRMTRSPREPVQVGSPFVLGQLLPTNVNTDTDTTRPLLVYVFSTRCGYCVKNLTAWAALADSAVSRGIGTMAISTDSVATEAAYIAKHSVRYAVHVAGDGREF